MPAVATTSFETAALVLGGLLVVGALLAGIAHRSFLSLTAVFVIAGFVLGRAGFGVLHFEPGSGFVSTLAAVALIVILFRDGLEVEAEMLQRGVPQQEFAVRGCERVGKDERAVLGNPHRRLNASSGRS